MSTRRFWWQLAVPALAFALGVGGVGCSPATEEAVEIPPGAVSLLANVATEIDGFSVTASRGPGQTVKVAVESDALLPAGGVVSVGETASIGGFKFKVVAVDDSGGLPNSIVWIMPAE